MSNIRESRTGGQTHWFCRSCATFDGPITEGRCDVCADAYKDGGDHVVWLVPMAERDRYKAALEQIASGTVGPSIMRMTACEVLGLEPPTWTHVVEAPADA